MTKIFHESNNLNKFLLDISTPIINYFDNKNSDFESNFRSACSDNRLFASSQTNYQSNDLDEKREQIFELTQNFLNTLMFLSEYVGCPCHNKSDNEYKNELNAAIKEYLEQLVKLWDNSNFERMLSEATIEFKENYFLAKNNLDELKSAEEDLYCWKDVISDELLQNSLISLRFTYIVKKLALI